MIKNNMTETLQLHDYYNEIDGFTFPKNEYYNSQQTKKIVFEDSSIEAYLCDGIQDVLIVKIPTYGTKQSIREALNIIFNHI